MNKKESLKDTARVLGSMYDAIEFRGFDQEDVDTLEQYSGVPVWNGLTDMDHPCLLYTSIDNDEFEYVPDFVKLAEAYGAQGIRVTKAEELEAAFTKADAFKKGPTLIECIVPTELNVCLLYTSRCV